MHGYFKFVRETSYYPMKRNDMSIYATFAVKSEIINIFLSYVQGQSFNWSVF